MLKHKLLIVTLFLISLPYLTIAQERNLLTSSYGIEFLKNNVLTAEDYKPFPPAGDPEWKNVLSDNQIMEIVQDAEELLDYDYPVLKASLYLDFVRNGNRSRFQEVYSDRRRVVEKLIMAEIIENKGRFVDDIVNGIWAMCEETSWVLPAHIGEQEAGSGLPDIQEPLTAILASETPSLFAAAEYFLADKLDNVSPLIRERMHLEVKRQLLDVMLVRRDIWWMGYTDRIPNNWNPWVISNYINAILIFEKDEERRAKGLYIAMEMLDNFLNPYPADGGCDEGPAYWNHAGGRVFNCLDQLYLASEGKINIYNEDLIVNIGDYIWKAWINDNWYVNFADAPAKMTPDYSLIFQYGKRTGSEQMMAFAKMLKGREGDTEVQTHYLMLRGIPGIFAEKEILEYNEDFKIESYLNLPDLEVSFARETDVPDKGLFFAVKGGHNDESHNHNDAGNFILYLNGQPLIVDAGVGEYTRKTFSSERYDIWTMQSSYHNLPEINHKTQKDGREFYASDFTSKNKGKKTLISMQLENAYPPDAAVNKFLRSLEFNRSKSQLTITDDFEFVENENYLKFNFLTNHVPVLKGGKVELINADNNETVAIIETGEKLEVIFEEIMIQDSRLSRAWKDKLFRISFETSLNSYSEKFNFIIKTL
ncbi:MAG: heparinase II/III domain-containing protein [Bacteroidales bacterium]